ncbi:MAG: topoisomerase DNA-binding C4 zinc finger domain-containing protein [Selenomonadaceae bacterium]|nr:topoisomerase DNA-binding C4 zinc finger domain-containing protein [Selenomonadaceae bacterium]
MAGKNLKSVILVENGTKARTLRKFVGRNYAVLSTDGFLKDLPKSRIGVDDEQGYLPDYITVRGKGQLLAELKRETLNARKIFLATAPDAQGEFMARQCCEIFGINPLSHCRIRLNELTRENFKAAFNSAQSIDNLAADSFQAKQLIDKYVSHRIGEYLERKIWRGVKVGRFRAMLLKLIAKTPAQENLTVGKILTPATLQELALKELNFSAGRTRFIADQLYEGIPFDKDCAGLITYPHAATIDLTSERRNPEDVREYLTEYQFKLYNLIYARLTDKNSVETLKLDGTANDATLMTAFDGLGVDWAEYYSVGVASLIKRKYITAADGTYKITALGQRVLDALDGFFDDVFSATAYNEVTAQVQDIAAGKIDKSSVITGYCTKFRAAFDEAMTSLGEDAQPQNEPFVESDEVCEKCGRKMIIRRGRYGAFLACSGYPECKNAKPLLERLEQLCPKCGGHLSKRELLHGRTFYCCENSPTCDFITWDEPQTLTCKICGSTMFMHRFKDRAPMLYCGNENCSTRENHPMNKILADIKRRAESRKARKSKVSESGVRSQEIE